MRHRLKAAVAAAVSSLVQASIYATVPVQQIEAFSDNPNGYSVVDFAGASQVTLNPGQLGNFGGGITFHAVPSARTGTSSSHAYAVGQLFYGNGSVAYPMVTDVYSDSFDNYFSNTVNDQGGVGGAGPLPGFFTGGAKIINNSYIADGGLADDLDAIRRINFMINREDVTYISSAASQSGDPNDHTVYYIGWSAYNALAVSGSDGFSPSASPGKTHADLGNNGHASFTAAIVSGYAAALYGSAQAASQPHALHGVVFRSLLMAGADKTMYARQTTNNLDVTWGAGQANYNTSLSILQGGEKTLLPVNSGIINGTAATNQQGWSYGPVAANGLYSVIFHSNGSLTGLTASLNWNVDQSSTASTIDTTDTGTIFPHINLELRPLSFTSGHYVLGSAYSDATLKSQAGNDNVQYLYYTPATALPSGDYAFLITGDSSKSANVGFSYNLTEALASQWALSTGGSWNSSANWTSGIPNGKTVQATFSNTLTAPSTVTLDGNRTVGQLNFNSTKSYTIATGSSGTFIIDDTGDSSGVNPSIVVTAGSHTITAPVILASGVTISTAANTTLALGGSISGSGSLTATGAGSLNILPSASVSVPVVATGNVKFAANNTGGVFNRLVPAISIGTSGSVVLSDPTNHANRTLLVTAVPTFAGSSGNWRGQLDLNGNDLIIRGGSLATVSNQLQSGLNLSAGYWDGQGIISTTAANDSTHRTTLGAIQTNVVTSFDGQPVTSSDVLVKYTWYGDADLNGVVNGNDYTLIDNGFNIGTLTGWWNGDFNYDGKIDGSDYSLIDNSFNTQTPTGLAESANLIATNTSEVAGHSSAVPEPASVGLIMLSSLSLLRRRRISL